MATGRDNRPTRRAAPVLLLRFALLSLLATEIRAAGDGSQGSGSGHGSGPTCYNVFDAAENLRACRQITREQVSARPRDGSKRPAHVCALCTAR